MAKIMKNMINIAFCRSIKVALYRCLTLIFDTCVSQVNPRGRMIAISVFQIEENASNIISLFRLYFV